MKPTQLTDRQQQQLAQTQQYVTQKLAHDVSGHDMAHIVRVVRLAKQLLANEQKANAFHVLMAAYLHDVADDKVVTNSERAINELRRFLRDIGLIDEDHAAILQILGSISFSQNLQIRQPLSLEGQLVQDADRLDAIGAVGIARTFYYGGHKHHVMHDPAAAPRRVMTKEDYRQPGTVINHFYEKLFLLRDQLNTTAAKKIAQERDAFMREFVQRFEQEWQGD